MMPNSLELNQIFRHTWVVDDTLIPQLLEQQGQSEDTNGEAASEAKEQYQRILLHSSNDLLQRQTREKAKQRRQFNFRSGTE